MTSVNPPNRRRRSSQRQPWKGRSGAQPGHSVGSNDESVTAVCCVRAVCVCIQHTHTPSRQEAQQDLAQHTFSREKEEAAAAAAEPCVLLDAAARLPSSSFIQRSKVADTQTGMLARPRLASATCVQKLDDSRNLQIASTIALCCVLHRCESQDIHRQEL
ncbi:hypothetical protein F1559_002769 [Cyanidiococcus yangmingshanensis]|uniref:Uncharacterized protein n=1 Tax=Cyanidiococcus yangmingshanensis TaxID=2690220 RepID=A0A7J7ICB3_9RHOD|nr:hypothetical protein F1559_002769 [Cyanidiococcus yangmingshanensis]